MVVVRWCRCPSGSAVVGTHGGSVIVEVLCWGTWKLQCKQFGEM